MPTETPGHAFVVPAYGNSPFLGACLRSLRGQSAPSPVVVATSTPSEALSAVAAAFDAPVLVNPRREGIAADWNFALEATQARYVTLAHQDDVYYPAFAARSLALLSAHEDAVLAFTGYIEIDDEGRGKTSKVSVVKHALEAATLC